jgi:hypothetical protein
VLLVLSADWEAEDNTEVLVASVDELMDFALVMNSVLDTNALDELPGQVVDLEVICKVFVLRAIETLVLEFAAELEEVADNLLVCEGALVMLLLVIAAAAACASKAMYSSCVSCPSSNPLAGAWGGSGGR